MLNRNTFERQDFQCSWTNLDEILELEAEASMENQRIALEFDSCTTY